MAEASLGQLYEQAISIKRLLDSIKGAAFTVTPFSRDGAEEQATVTVQATVLSHNPTLKQLVSNLGRLRTECISLQTITNNLASLEEKQGEQDTKLTQMMEEAQ